MKIESSHFDQLPFSKLFRDYTTGNDNISQYFETNPDFNSLIQSAEHLQFIGDRLKTVSLLKDFNQQFDAGESTIQQIEKLSDPQCLTVVTGQQVSLLGGPLYTIYKTLTAIHYARKLQKEIGQPVIPVFWLADEDHDLEEVSEVNLAGTSTPVNVSYNHNDYTLSPPPAGSIELGEEYERFKQAVIEQLDDTDFSDRLWTELGKCYQKKRTFLEGFGRWLLKLFGDDGLVLAGSNNKDLKEYSKSIFKTAVIKQQEIIKTLDDTTFRLIEDGYHDQVKVQASNLFYLSENNYRQKIHFNEKKWSTSGQSWSSSELIEEIDKYPQNFSPNVFLRPILQDHLLPVAGYVGGPGEIAYYAQMKDFYHNFGKTMPVIIPRFSITLIEAALDRIINKLPFGWTEYKQRIEDLEKLYVDDTEDLDIERMFSIWRSQIEELSSQKKENIRNIDPTLAASVGKAGAVYFSELDKLKGKVYRAVKDQEKIQLDRILRIKQNLFPNGSLQEREIAFIYYMNKYGMQVWDKVLDLLEKEEPFTHKRIFL